MSIITMVLIFGGAGAFLLLLVGLVITMTSERSLVEERLGRYIQDQAADAKTKGQRGSLVGDWLNVRLEKSSWGDRIARELARADIKLKTSEYLAIIVIIGVVTGFIAWYVGGRNIFIAVIGAVAGTFIPRSYVGRQQTRRLYRFNDQLSDMLNLMVNGLRAGYSTMQAMEAVSRELPPPISEEYHRVVQEMQLGISAERALENLLRRIPACAGT